METTTLEVPASEVDGLPGRWPGLVRGVVWRVIGLIVTLLIASFLIFSATFLVPGSVVSTITGGRSLDPEVFNAVREQYHLNDPFLNQYLSWLTNVLHGDFGFSIVSREPVSSLVADRVPTTLALLVYSSALVLVFGLILAVVGATSGRRTNAAVMGLTSLGIAIPTFVAAAGFIWLFSVRLGWFPVVGAGDGGLDTLWHLTLPAVSLSIMSIAYVARIGRTSIREQLDELYVETARSRGLSERYLLRHHVLRNAALPMSTAIGITIAGLLAGTVVVEDVFSLPGLGSLLVRAVEQKDYAVAQAVALILVAGFIVINTMVDVLYHFLDPRLRRAAS